MRVTVVFDQDFGAHDLPELGDAFWLIESPHNRALASRLWAAATTDPNSAVFKAPDGASLEDQIMARLDDVDLHHPNWTEITFRGASLTEESRRQFVGQGFTIVASDDGFLVTR